MRSAFTQLKTPQSSRHPVQTPAEISEAHLRAGMDLEALIPLLFLSPPDWAVAQSAVRAFHQANPASIAVPATCCNRVISEGRPFQLEETA